MICCKIIADYNNQDASFSKLIEILGKKGDWLWTANSLYFADTEGPTDEKAVIRAVKKAGYTKVYVDVYDKNNEPHEIEDIKYWIAGKLVKINYLQFERENQKVLQETKKGLDEVEEALNGLIKDALAAQTKESETTEDSNNG